MSILFVHFVLIWIVNYPPPPFSQIMVLLINVQIKTNLQLITPLEPASASDAKKRMVTNNNNKRFDDSVGGSSSSSSQVGGITWAPSPAQSDGSGGGCRLTVDAAVGFLNDDSSNEGLVVDYDSPKCSPGESQIFRTAVFTQAPWSQLKK